MPGCKDEESVFWSDWMVFLQTNAVPSVNCFQAGQASIPCSRWKVKANKVILLKLVTLSHTNHSLLQFDSDELFEDKLNECVQRKQNLCRINTYRQPSQNTHLYKKCQRHLTGLSSKLEEAGCNHQPPLCVGMNLIRSGFLPLTELPCFLHYVTSLASYQGFNEGFVLLRPSIHLPIYTFIQPFIHPHNITEFGLKALIISKSLSILLYQFC